MAGRRLMGSSNRCGLQAFRYDLHFLRPWNHKMLQITIRMMMMTMTVLPMFIQMIVMIVMMKMEMTKKKITENGDD